MNGEEEKDKKNKINGKKQQEMKLCIQEPFHYREKFEKLLWKQIRFEIYLIIYFLFLMCKTFQILLWSVYGVFIPFLMKM